MMNYRLIGVFAIIFLLSALASAAPFRTTYQAKIIKPDGLPLEASSVNFRFTILDPTATCVMYVEDYSAINMHDSGGLAAFSLGAGVRSFPTSGTSSTFSAIFDNSITSFSCQTAGVYLPVSSDIRKIVMQFNDGTGWQSLQAMTINAVPYSMYASKSDNSIQLNGKSDTAFVEYSTLAALNCQANEAIKFNGASFSCLAVGGSVTSGSVITALGYTPADGVSVTALSSSLSSTNSTVTSVSSTVSSLAASFAAMTSSQWNTSGTTINYMNGNVGIGTTTPVTKLDVSGGLRISMEPATCAASFAGTLRYNAGNVEYCNGTTWSAFGVSGAGLQSLNGSTSATQSFAMASGGTAPSIVTANGVHTLSIPYAASSSVTGGLLSNADYTAFANKLNSTSAAVISALGYTPANDAVSGSYLIKVNNLSDLSSSAAARANLGLGGFATINSLDLGSASATGTLDIARLPAFTGDATIAAASNTVVLSNSGVTAGTYTKVTVDAKGRVTSSTQLSSSDVTAALGYTPVSSGSVVSSQWNTSGATINYMAGDVGIGTTTPSAKLTLSNNTSMPAAPHSTTMFHLVPADGSASRITLDSFGTASAASPNLSFRAAGGTAASPTATASGDILGQVSWFGYGSTGYASSARAAIRAVAADNWTDASQTTHIALLTTAADSSGTATEKMRITASGNVGIGTTTPTAYLHLKAGTPANAPLKFTSGTLLTSPQSGTMEYDGANFYLTDSTNTRRTIATGSSQGSIDNVSNINSSGNITLTPTGSVIVSSTTASTNSNTGALVVKGGLGVAGNIYASGSIVTSSNIQGSEITATSATITPFVYGSTVSGGVLTLDSTTHVNKGVISLAPAGGNVGIGTTAPTSILQTLGSTAPKFDRTYTDGNSSRQVLQLARLNSSGVGAAGIGGHIDMYVETTTEGTLEPVGQFRAATTDATAGGIDSYLAFSTVNNSSMSEKMRIDNLGNVGIGTTVPGALLDIKGGASDNTVVRLVNTNGNAWGLWNDNGSNSLNVQYGGATKMVMQSGGNVGIGTTTPGAPLSFADSKVTKIQFNGNNANGYQVGLANSVNGGDALYKFDAGLTSAGEFGFYSAGTSKMFISSSGNVGIGTTSPATKFHIAGQARVDGSLLFNDENGNDGTKWGIYGWDDAFTFSKRNSDATFSFNATYMTIKDGGNVGIGTTTPSSKLHVSGTITADGLTDSSPGNALYVTTASTTAGPGSIYMNDSEAKPMFEVAPMGPRTNYSWLRLDAGTDTLMPHIGSFASATNPGLSLGVGAIQTLNINFAGNVGISTTSPNYLLDVNGSALIRGSGAHTVTAPSYGGTYFSFDGATNTAGLWSVNNTTSQFAFYTKTGNTDAGTERMRITQTGNVGIGTTNPAYPLHIEKNTNFSMLLKNTGTGDQCTGIITDNTSDPSYASWMHTCIQSGIPRLKLGVTNKSYGWVSNPLEIDLRAPTSTLYINNLGNIGIGTTGPSEKLHVVGNLRVQGSTDCTLGNGAGGTNCSSDARLKENIKPIPYALEKVVSLKGVEFDWNAKSLSYGRHDIGVIAQDVEKVFPTAVMNDKNTGYRKVDYAVLVAPLIEAVKSLYYRIVGVENDLSDQKRQIASIVSLKADKAEIEVLKQKAAEVDALKVENADLKNENSSIKAYLCSKDPAAPFCK